jgi:hypothetical protein
VTVSNLDSSCGPSTASASPLKVGACHGDDVGPAPPDKLPKVQAELVVRIGRDVVELIDSDEAVIELLYPVGIDREAERRMGADQHLVSAL